MSAPRPYAWCPTCAEQVTPLPSGKCVWCDTPTSARAPRRRGKPTGVYGYLTDAQVRAVHRLYEQGLSLRACAARIQPRTRYASVKSCSVALHDHFVRLGLPRRDRIEATVAASTIHGLARDPEHRRALRRRIGEIAGRTCAGRKMTYPGKGRPCLRPALAGSDYCIGHDPERRAEVLATLAKARARQAA